MSHAFMPMYWGDYLRDTGHLSTEQHGTYLLLIAHCWQHGAIPNSAGERAAIAKLSVGRWNKLKDPIERFFAPDGTHKRVTLELERTERKVLQAKRAGREGGLRSGISRSIQRGEAIAQAERKRTLEKRRSGKEADGEADAQAERKRTRTNQKEYISSFFPTAAKDEETQPAPSLATALPAGALARAPTSERAEGKQEFEKTRPCDLSGDALRAAIARRGANGG